MEIKLIKLNESPVSKDECIDIIININNKIYSGLLFKKGIQDENN